MEAQIPDDQEELNLLPSSWSEQDRLKQIPHIHPLIPRLHLNMTASCQSLARTSGKQRMADPLQSAGVLVGMSATQG